MRNNRFAISLLGIVCALLGAEPAFGQFLFDATKAEMAGNADWVVDADTHNIGTGIGGAMTAGAGTDSNPQRVPTPAASGIISSTAETYWDGALSQWGVTMVKHGQTVETLPFNGRITYNDGTNSQDLSHYKVFVVDEPNTLFSSTEKAAIYSFVKNGGGLFMISDHGSSDRNGDGVDSVDAWNDLLAADGATLNPLGIQVNGNNVSPDSLLVDTNASDPITHGSAGTVTEFVYHNGSTFTLSTSANASVKGAVWSTSIGDSANAMVAYGTYGSGRFVAVGDSSPIEDGTGDPNDTLFDGWDEGSGNDGKLVTNASLFLAPVPEPGSGFAVGLAFLAAAYRRRRG